MSSDTDNRVFVMVTMNRTKGVDSAMLRSGRFDRVWSTDLPDRDERMEILKIHLEKRGIDPADYGKALDRVVSSTNEYTGAELEEIVISARNDAYDDRMSAWEEAGGKKSTIPGKEDVRPTIEEILAAVDEITPVAHLDAEDIAEIRKFCQDKAYPVNGERVSDTKRGRATRRVSTARSAKSAAGNEHELN
jgi:SpoVK/Ycf46/Vps4 family AAA+-type ATPase